MTEEQADDNLTDWLELPTHAEGYAFAAVTGVSEVLEPRSLTVANLKGKTGLATLGKGDRGIGGSTQCGNMRVGTGTRGHGGRMSWVQNGYSGQKKDAV